MSCEPRVRLDMPFIRASSGSAPSEPAMPPAFDIDKYLRRVPVPQRPQADYTGRTMARHIGGLETRLVDHLRKHAPRWHDAETRRVLNCWSSLRPNAPAPSWAPPRNVLTDARHYAGQLVRERVAQRLQRLHDICGAHPARPWRDRADAAFP